MVRREHRFDYQPNIQQAARAFGAMIAAVAILLWLPLCAIGQDAAEARTGAPVARIGKLTYVTTFQRDSLQSVNSITIDQTGHYVYASSWGAATINVFARNAETGLLTPVEDITSQRDLKGVTSIRLSDDNQYGVSAAFTANTTSLFRRDTINGKLELLDVARRGEKGVQGLEWAIDAAISLDNNFLFVADPKGAGASNPAAQGNLGAIVVFERTNSDRLRWIETNIGIKDCFNGVRGIVMLPDGKTLVATCNTAACVVLLDWDKESKRTSIRQIINDGGREGATALNGAMKSVFNKSGTVLYVSSGRFQGDSSVSVFRIDKSGKAHFVQEMIEGLDIPGFTGGNDLCLSADGRNLYVAATRSGALACFEIHEDTGKLKLIETLTGRDNPTYLNGAAGVTVSPDGKFVYVTAEQSNGISIFKRNVDG